ncbi:MAG TPA: hypothetical protein VF116_09370 [Ktedonobacterales bacterium]
MNLDDQLAELLARLGVILEDDEPAHDGDGADSSEHGKSGTSPGGQTAISPSGRFTFGGSAAHAAEDENSEIALSAPPEVSLFQTSREHYGVFYRLDLVAALPHLRIFMPDDEGALKMRCYLVRAAPHTPLHDWFVRAREHDGSPAYEDARDAARQHLLFATGELMKRLFWGGDIERMSFPAEIEVLRLV